MCFTLESWAMIPSPVATYHHESTGRSKDGSYHQQLAPFPHAHRYGSGVSQASCCSMMSRTMCHSQSHFQISTHHTPPDPYLTVCPLMQCSTIDGLTLHGMNSMHRRSLCLYYKPPPGLQLCPWRSQSISSRGWNGCRSRTLHGRHIAPSNTT
jgi:hypothetical protein